MSKESELFRSGEKVSRAQAVSSALQTVIKFWLSSLRQYRPPQTCYSRPAGFWLLCCCSLLTTELRADTNETLLNDSGQFRRESRDLVNKVCQTFEKGSDQKCICEDKSVSEWFWKWVRDNWNIFSLNIRIWIARVRVKLRTVDRASKNWVDWSINFIDVWILFISLSSGFYKYSCLVRLKLVSAA